MRSNVHVWVLKRREMSGAGGGGIHLYIHIIPSPPTLASATPSGTELGILLWVIRGGKTAEFSVFSFFFLFEISCYFFFPCT